MKISFTCLAFLIICLFGCKSDKPVKYMKVYDGATYDKEVDSLKKNTAVSGIYYCFNYKDTDLKGLLQMLDTITFDTAYRYHEYRFLKYNSSLPDTLELRKARLNDDYSKLENPSSSKFYKFQIINVSYNRHYQNEGRNFPNHYIITFYNKGGEKYFLKDSVTNKLREIPIEFLYPHINDPH